MPQSSPKNPRTAPKTNCDCEGNSINTAQSATIPKRGTMVENQSILPRRDTFSFIFYSPSLFKSVIEGTEYVEEVITTSDGEKKTVIKQVLDPMEVMKKTLMNERYDRVLL